MCGWVCTGQGPVVVSCEHSNKPFSFMKGIEFLNYLNDCYLLSKFLELLG
jgi:hypothetical protein